MASKSGKATALWKALREFSGKLPGRVKGLPRWTRVLGIVVIVGIVAALVVPYFLDVDRYRTAVATTIEQQTGRPVSIGKFRARLLPTVGFVIEDFRLGNPSGFGAGDVLTADAVKGNLAFWPLLRKEFQLRSLEIVRPRLLLLENDSGQTNYGDFPARHSSGVPPRGGSAAPAGMQLA